MKRIVLAATLSLLAAAGWRFAEACAPDLFKAVFSYARHPDLPRTEFIDGRLGVMQPTFARSYLVIAYRYLNGTGMNPREREQARDYYKDRDTASWDPIGADWPARWRATRSRIASPPAPPAPLITGGQLAYDSETHSFALNCAEDAYRIALHTLDARRSQFGAGSVAFRSWVGAQDAVFHNCVGGKAEIPQEASTGLPALVRADRAYQIAAAHFYAGEHKEALEQFRAIGRNASSPWQTISRYLVVRTLLRMTGDAKTAPQTAVQTSAQAGGDLQTEAQAILADAQLAPVHGMTGNLVQRAGIREKDPQYFRELARLLSARGQDNGLREELWNYTDLYDRVIGENDPNNAHDRPSQPASADIARVRDADLSDWIFSFQWRGASMFPHCLKRWQQTRSLAWLLAALSHCDAAGAQSAGLLDAAAAIPETSPAFLTARFHLLRLYQELGDKSTARDGMDAVLAGAALKNLPSSVNLFRGLRMLAAPTFDDFARFALRKPVLITQQIDFGEKPGLDDDWERGRRPKTEDLFDEDAVRILNRETPFRFLKGAAIAESLPPELRREALMTAFTRGLMLGEDLSEIAGQIANLQPDLAPFTNAYVNEKDEGGRRFAAAFLLLHRPEARPYFASGISRQSKPGKLDPYRDNWWCPVDIEMELDSPAHEHWYWPTPNLVQSSAAKLTPEFLTGSASVESKGEIEKLGKLSAATDFLGSIVLPFAESHREEARMPEALYWLVRAGHYGCADTNTWKTARAAFRMLHARYPQSTWAKRTPSWFKNDYDIRREMHESKSRQARN